MYTHIRDAYGSIGDISPYIHVHRYVCTHSINYIYAVGTYVLRMYTYIDLFPLDRESAYYFLHHLLDGGRSPFPHCDAYGRLGHPIRIQFPGLDITHSIQ